MEDHTESPATELERLTGAWADAELRGDTAYLESNLVDDFVAVGPRGFVPTRDQWLERHASGKLTYGSFARDETRTRIYGDAAVIVGRQTAEVRYEDGDIHQDIRDQFRGTLVFVKRGGSWGLAGIHLSPVARDVAP